MANRAGTRLAVAAALSAVLAGTVAAIAGAASRPALAPLSPAELLAATARAVAANPDVSGQLALHVDLGLPSLPEHGPQALDPLSRLFGALNGDHRVRLWRSAAGSRVAELLPTAELAMITRHGGGSAEAWAWDSLTFTAYHLGPVPLHGGVEPTAPIASPDPLAATSALLRALRPSTAVSVGQAGRVAGRDAYRLELEPRSPGSLIGRIELSVDAERRVPLGLAVYARGARSPAVSMTFTSVSFAPVDPSLFTFTPPPGATVKPLAPALRPIGPAGAAMEGAHADGPPTVRTFGSAWDAVVAVRVPPVSGGGAGGLGLDAFLPFSGPLFSAQLLERGDHAWVLVGAVPSSRLSALEPQLP